MSQEVEVSLEVEVLRYGEANSAQRRRGAFARVYSLACVPVLSAAARRAPLRKYMSVLYGEIRYLTSSKL